MSNSKPGLQRFIVCQSGTLLTTHTGLITIGSRKPVDIDFEPYKTQKDYLDRELKNRMKISCKPQSYQLRLRDLQWLLIYVQSGFDLQMVADKQSSGAASGGRFDFLNWENGLDFEYVLANNDRYIEVAFETAMEHDLFVAMLNVSDAYPSVLPAISSDPISGGNEKGENFTNYRYLWYASIEAPTGTEIFGKKEIMERKFSIKTIGKKNDDYAETVVNRLLVELTMKGTNASISKLVELFNKDVAPSVTVKEMLSSTLYEQFTFNPNVLTMTTKGKIGDNDRFAEVKISGQINFHQVSFAYGAANGGVGTGTEVGQDLTEEQARQGGVMTAAA